MTAARRRRRWFYRAAFALLVVSTALYVAGFRWVFAPLTLCWSLLMWRGAYWDGWINAQSQEEGK